MKAVTAQAREAGVQQLELTVSPEQTQPLICPLKGDPS
jgi:hypothetical protein